MHKNNTDYEMQVCDVNKFELLYVLVSCFCERYYYGTL